MNGSTSKAEMGLIIGLLFFIVGMAVLIVTILFLDYNVFCFVFAAALAVLGIVMIALGAKLKKASGGTFNVSIFKKRSKVEETPVTGVRPEQVQYQYTPPQANQSPYAQPQAYQQPVAPMQQPQQPMQPEQQMYQQPIAPMQPQQPMQPEQQMYQQPIAPVQPEPQAYQQPVAPAYYGAAGAAYSQPPVQGIREAEPVRQYGVRDAGDVIMRFCPGCGEKRMDLTKPFCPNCGLKMEWQK